jgi:hypothetical protein
MGDGKQSPAARWAVSATLALFLLGSNYCLVDAVAGALGHPARHPCHPAAARSSERSPCCHAQPRSAGPERPAPAGSMPCCLTYVPAPSPQLDRIAASTFTPDAFALEVSVERVAGAGVAQALDTGPDARPPKSLPSPALRGRAPPLA